MSPSLLGRDEHVLHFDIIGLYFRRLHGFAQHDLLGPYLTPHDAFSLTLTTEAVVPQLLRVVRRLLLPDRRRRASPYLEHHFVTHYSR